MRPGRGIDLERYTKSIVRDMLAGKEVEGASVEDYIDLNAAITHLKPQAQRVVREWLRGSTLSGAMARYHMTDNQTRFLDHITGSLVGILNGEKDGNSSGNNG